MPDRFFKAHQLWKIKQVLRNGKLTLLCLVLTVVVIQKNLDARKFGTPQEDFNEIRDHFYSSPCVEQHRVLEEASPPPYSSINHSSTVSSPNKYNILFSNFLWMWQFL
ncbi:Xyloglucan 6-xylosyltransferase 1 [Camellia lanceoleosa]|uniref:Xyloglucan 6-xylosyltransferase 1 n=1 Tax=Camellia lanceoleosa TaxID=1840588 RepID=A0ACC0F1M9_9ERIC|nr:Xyloglucan 6-xylosyltransferase 1 [Camellia lanceoleosa]